MVYSLRKVCVPMTAVPPARPPSWQEQALTDERRRQPENRFLWCTSPAPRMRRWFVVAVVAGWVLGVVLSIVEVLTAEHPRSLLQAVSVSLLCLFGGVAVGRFVRREA